MSHEMAGAPVDITDLGITDLGSADMKAPR
jgi:hypothetical protein